LAPRTPAGTEKPGRHREAAAAGTEHCDAVGRDYVEIEKDGDGPTRSRSIRPKRGRALIDSIRHLSALGVTRYHGSVPHAASITPIGMLGERAIPAVAEI
jgi:hypothetical protein